MQTIALYTTETMADWEYAHLTTQIATAEEVRPGRFRLLLVGDGLDPVRSLGGLPTSPGPAPSARSPGPIARWTPPLPRSRPR